MMRYFILCIMLLTTLNAKNMGIVLIDNKVLHYKDSITKDIESLFQKQSHHFISNDKVTVTIDRDKKVKKIFTHGGAKALIAYAKKNHYDSISLVEYKRGSKVLSTVVVVADTRVKDRKSRSVAFHQKLSGVLNKTVLSSVLMLNYQLGVFNAANRY